MIQGELIDDDKLSLAVSKCNVIISSLGPSGYRVDDTKLFASYYADNIFPALRHHSVKRIYAMGTISIHRLEDKPSFVRWFAIAIFGLVYPNLLATILEIEKTFDSKADGLEWLVFRIAAIIGASDEASWQKDRENGDAFVGWVAERGWTMSQKRSALAK